jgi:DNA repair protein RecO (recombination protein O)
MPDVAFILHRYPYKETSLLLKVFTREQGLISLIIKGAKKQRSDAYSMLQCFQPLSLDYTLKGELGSLKQVERKGEAPALQNEALYSAFYLNELLLFLLHPHDPAPKIFDLYAQTLTQLETHLELSLRIFELNFLNYLGFLPELHRDETGAQVQDAAAYWLTPGHLPRQMTQTIQGAQLYVFKGEELNQLRAGVWTPETLKAAKRLCRIFIEDHTRGKVFKSRELFTAARGVALQT